MKELEEGSWGREALHEIRRAAQDGNPSACALLGHIYWEGKVVPKNIPEALQWYRKAARSGHQETTLILGDLYREGRGVPQDLSQALKWYRRAAPADREERKTYYHKIFNAFGDLYRDGSVIPKSALRAARWYSRAAWIGSAESRMALGLKYSQGADVPQSFSQALKWYRCAAPAAREERKAYYVKIFHSFGDLCRDGDIIPRNFHQTARWYSRAARLGSALSQRMLGDLYHLGQGVEQNRDRARFWYEKAAAQSDYPAMERLFPPKNKTSIACEGVPENQAADASLWYKYATFKIHPRFQFDAEHMDKNFPEWRRRAKERLRDSPVFCILPWMHLSAWPTGDVYPCCATWKASPLGNLKKDALPKLWNSPAQKQMRLNMLQGKKSSACARCYEAEDCGSPSQRQNMNKKFPHRYDIVERTQTDGTVEPFRIFYLDFRFSNACNFRCRTCGPTFSSSWHADYAALTGKQSETLALLRPGESDDLWTRIEDILPNLEEIYFAGGEPLLMEEHFRILDFLIKRKLFHVRLLYSTNFSLTHFQDHDIYALWDRFETVHVGASIDAMGRRGEYIRKGQKWEDILANRERMARVCPRANFSLISTLSALNSLCLPDLQKEFIEKGYVSANNIIVNLVMTPEHYQLRVLPQNLKEQVKDKYARHIKTVLEPLGADAQAAIAYLNGAVEFMMSQDLPEERRKFREITAKLDALREENFSEIFPELRELIS